MAVGLQQPSGFVPLAEQWNGTSWTVVPSPVPAGATHATFNGISCLATTFCIATGYQDTPGQVPLAEQWNGSSWSLLAVPVPAGSTTSELNGVSCRTPAFCVAAGAATVAGGGQGLIEQWNGAAWAIVPSPTQPNGEHGFLDTVSCAGLHFCAAVGEAYGGSIVNSDNLVEIWNGSSWSISPTPEPASGDGAYLLGVSCFSATSCSAVGYLNTTSNGSNYVPEALTWDGGATPTWTLVATPFGSGTPATQQAQFNAVDCISDWACVAAGYTLDPGTLVPFNAWAPIARSGYRFVASDGGVFNYGPGAPFLGSLGGTHLNAPIVGMAVMPAGDGYDLVGSDGGIFTYGSAQFYGSTGALHLNAPVVGMAITSDGGGYWLVAADGGIFSYGDAQFYGSTGAIHLNKPIVGMAPTPNGLGYWLVASDGGIFNYGNAPFLGSTGGLVLNKPVVGMAATTAGQYYLVASDGGIFSFPTSGGPPFLGSTGAIVLNKPIVGMTTVSGGYYLSGSDGGIFAFPPGGPPFFGSTGAIVLNKPIVGVAS
jgi:hypothetical protein